MVLLKNYDEYCQLLRGVKKSPYMSNCYFLPDKIKELIGRNKLYSEIIQNNVYLYEKEEGFFRMYYFIVDRESRAEVKCELPVVVELPYSRELTEKQKSQTAFLKNSGFMPARESSQMSVTVSDVILYHTPLQNNDIRFDFAEKKDKVKLKEMLYSIHNPLFGFLPDDRKMDQLIDGQNLIVAYYKLEIAGVLNVEIEKKQAWMRHLVVSAGFRGKSIGGRLFNEGHVLYRERVKEYKCWVDVHNVPSVELHRKFGYHFDDKKALEYVYMPE